MALKKGDIYGYMTGLAQKAIRDAKGCFFCRILTGINAE